MIIIKALSPAKDTDPKNPTKWDMGIVKKNCTIKNIVPIKVGNKKGVLVYFSDGECAFTEQKTFIEYPNKKP